MADHAALPLLTPAWPAPSTVGACFTVRAGGVGMPPWDGFNLATHVGDDPLQVVANRARLRATLGLRHEPCWLEQVHGNHVVRLHEASAGVVADATITTIAGLACVVMVADCVPLLLCAADGSEVAAVHAGWRGLAGGIIGRTVAAFGAAPPRLLAWVGPCIGPGAYVVGNDVRRQLLAATVDAQDCFSAAGDGWYCDLAALATRQLAAAGVASIARANTCVYSDRTRFYSYRRDGVTGRNAALIWLKSG